MKRFAAILVCLLPASLQAAGLVSAEHAMRAGNYAEAYCVLRPMAEYGDPEAQYNIGWMYQNGYGLAVNNSLALEWWRRAAEQGHVDASFAIATLYHHGEGEVDADKDKALDYFLLAATKGHDDATLILRSMLIRNDKSIRDRRKTLVNDHANLFGPLKQVKAKRLNVRIEPSLEAGIVTRLEKGHKLVEINTRADWSQVGIIGDGTVAWVYSPLLEDWQSPPQPRKQPQTQQPSRQPLQQQPRQQWQQWQPPQPASGRP